MFYNSSWKSGFLTGLITGVAIYAMAKTPRGRNILDKLSGLGGFVKDQLTMMAKQTTDMLDGAVKVADNLSRQEENAQMAANI